MRQVAEFADQNALSDITPLLQKGALVAQNPAAWDSVPGLTDRERQALDDEVVHKWRQPRAMYMTVILCSVGAAVQYVSLLGACSRAAFTNATQGLGSDRQ